MKIQVTQEDIDKAKNKSPTNRCPIGNALERYFPGKDVRIDRSYRGSLDLTVFKFSEAAIEFMKRFDYGDLVNPSEFEEEIPT